MIQTSMRIHDLRLAMGKPMFSYYHMQAAIIQTRLGIHAVFSGSSLFTEYILQGPYKL